VAKEAIAEDVRRGHRAVFPRVADTGDPWLVMPAQAGIQQPATAAILFDMPEVTGSSAGADDDD
jgi:hypothetical protein